MPIAFVLLNTEIGAESEVVKFLRKVDAVEEAYVVFGVYDVIAKIKANAMGELKEIVTRHLRSLDKVRSTLTMMAIDGT